MTRKWAAKLLSRFRMQKTFVKRASRHAARRRANTRAEHIERLQAKSQPVARCTNPVLSRHFAILEFQFTYRMGRQHLSSLNNAEARHSCRNNECGYLGATIFAGSGAREDSVEIGDAGV